VETVDGAEAQARITTAGAEVPPYLPPTLTVVGSVYDLTLTGGGHRCFFGKKWGGSDGVEYMNQQISISSC
jgi:hypothetical protein